MGARLAIADTGAPGTDGDASLTARELQTEAAGAALPVIAFAIEVLQQQPRWVMRLSLGLAMQWQAQLGPPSLDRRDGCRRARAVWP
ncbi:hypothetical protein [Streptomyces sp. DASNCL29]|uniref:hypothetical protein n=1 Tax=Streptomyces sp. DASNCL29 TaxID=2583819 RepID=UPI00110FCEE2|nr:hypothetical protein [Streptomyces sp. DASNCL29]TMU97052.1 hypothetical protein FGK60_03510 [Streptomyces sp. DASNCL29]